jgi:Fungal specific transcription factor domain
MQFRNETEHVVQKAIRKSQLKLEKEIMLSQQLNQPVVDVAWSYFNCSFPPGSNFDYLPNMFDEFSSSKCFRTSVRAAALANLARDRRDAQIMHISRTVYVKAVKDVNAALKSPHVSQNSTLVATMVLGLFEALVLNDARNKSVRSCIDSWIAHTNGTMSLIRFRGMELLQTEFGRRIYYQVANRVRANTSRLNARLTPEFLAIDKQIAPHIQNLNPVVRYWPIIDMTIALKARQTGKRMQMLSVFFLAKNMSKELHLHNPVHTVEYIVELDTQSSKLLRYYDKIFAATGLGMTAPPKESFRKVANTRIGCDLFRFTATMRMMRIYWCNIAHKNLEIIIGNHDASFTNTMRNAWINLQQAFVHTARAEADLLLAGLPFYLPPGQSPISPSSVGCLIWPLSTFGASQQLTAAQKTAAKAALLQIGERANISVATKLAQNHCDQNSDLPEEAHMIHLTWQM